MNAAQLAYKACCADPGVDSAGGKFLKRVEDEAAEMVADTGTTNPEKLDESGLISQAAVRAVPVPTFETFQVLADIAAWQEFHALEADDLLTGDPVEDARAALHVVADRLIRVLLADHAGEEFDDE